MEPSIFLFVYIPNKSVGNINFGGQEEEEYPPCIYYILNKLNKWLPAKGWVVDASGHERLRAFSAVKVKIIPCFVPVSLPAVRIGGWRGSKINCSATASLRRVLFGRGVSQQSPPCLHRMLNIWACCRPNTACFTNQAHAIVIPRKLTAATC